VELAMLGVNCLPTEALSREAQLVFLVGNWSANQQSIAQANTLLEETQLTL
jgi:ATP/maltotriose-dependent transcriptional regulator MalT